ncbi:MAG: CRTAC1 family protein, partial [Cyclobacteriaceae bacterium]|nr:CRTAC1 family protein [Cyclobacteriaceae bacterium]
GRNFLYHNNGDGTFEEVGQKTGISQHENYWAGVTWGDYDLDGNLDIYVCGYVDYQTSANRGVTLQYNAEVPTSINPSSFKPIGNLLFHNNGNGTFTEIAEKSGVLNENGRSLSAAWCDFDDDGLPDLYVANDVSDNALFRNKGDGTFEDVSYTSFVADYRGAMGIGTGDWDNDTDVDMFITHWMAQENALYSNLMSQLNTKDISAGNRIKFMDEADRYGLGQIALQFIGFGTFFFDYNNDTKLDIFIANGSTFQKRDNPAELTPMKDQLLWNQGSKEGFFDVSPVSGNYFGETYVGRGAAYADYDNDGDLDVLVVNNIGPAKLLRNEGGNKQNWIQLKLEKKQEKHIWSWYKNSVWFQGKSHKSDKLVSQGSYFSQNSLIQHFGLDDHTTVDTLEITWPGGKKQLMNHLASNQLIIVAEE